MPGEWYTLYSKVQWWIRRLSRWHTGTLPPLWLTFQPGDSKMCNGGSHQQVKRNQIPHSPTAIELVSGWWEGWLTLWWLTNFLIQKIANKKLAIIQTATSYYYSRRLSETPSSSCYQIILLGLIGVVKTWFVWPCLMKMPQENLLLLALKLVLVAIAIAFKVKAESCVVSDSSIFTVKRHHLCLVEVV